MSTARTLHRALTTLILSAGATTPLGGQQPELSAGHASAAPVAHATRRPGPLVIDGRLTDAAWAAADPITVFRQIQPAEGSPATQRTEIRILYDADNLYVGARMFDTAGSHGVRGRLVRRDQQLDLDNGNNSLLTSDKLTVILDPFHDHLTRAVFEINPSGVIGDALGAGGSALDASWDPVWQGAAIIDSLGWTAELRIPFSQLRFANRAASQTWGLQVIRTIDRLNERDEWAFAPKNENTGPASYGHLTGLVLEGGSRALDLLPYVSEQTRDFAGFRGDPLNRVHENQVEAGLDLLYQLGSSFTLNATINPDFGQVELDPTVLNLSAFETFFPEKRPFFVSGAGAFDFGGFQCYFCSNTNPLSLFYSRRIGRYPELGDYYSGIAPSSNIPAATSILGAAKITGHTEGGSTVGVLDAVTNQANGSYIVAPDSKPHTVAMEPLSNYLVGRIKRDFQNGATVVGGMVTSTLRNLDAPMLADSLHRHAEAAGADFTTAWANHHYTLMGNVAFSDVGGTAQSILQTEQSSAHYFQRPDRAAGASGLFASRYDSTATSLRGYSAYLRLGKDAGNWLWEGATNLRSPGFEVNDLSYMQRADFIWNVVNLARQWTAPGSWYRDIFGIVGAQTAHNYEGDQIDRQGQAFVRVDFLNYWGLRAFYVERPTYMDDQLTRGGPVEKHRGYRDGSLFVNTDPRQWISVQAQVEALWGIDEVYRELLPQVSVLIKPTSNIAVTLGPSADLQQTRQQYVTAIADQPLPEFGNTRYVFSNLNQTTLSLDTRIAIAFTPTITLDVYAQPFFASGHYFAFKQFDHPRQLHKSIFGSDLGSIAHESNGNYCIDPNGPPGAVVPVCSGPLATTGAFEVANPDFNTRSLRGNAVLRWEFHPGSTLYLVWQQTRSDDTLYGETATFALERDRGLLFRAPAQNVISLKVAFWLNARK